ncbi:MAG: hypothetical protein EP343_26990 [Deltaproteobacteria bacterium]|nr:MAG: hypothetical protein EP343_26990 [Deltaproteobacteria bacterium]
MSRIAKADVHASLERIAQTIIQAGGEDGRISRADMAAQLETMDGTERALANMFFRFIDHRDYKPGATVTAKDVNRAVEYAKEKLIDKYDLNNNGLSKSEISEMSRTGQLAVQLAKEIKTVDEVGPSSGEALSKQFEMIADGLLYISEGDYPYEAFTLPKTDSGEHTVESFREGLGLDADVEISMSGAADVDEFFALYQDAVDGYGYDEAEVQQYKDLETAMKGNLTDLKMVHVGGDAVVEGQVYIVGTAPDGTLAGLETTRIWT